jgi:predicted ATP-dependent endonuclease of OLD family
MKIRKFEIENYRNLKNISIEFRDLTIFIGKNDVGKSNILKALDLFFNMLESEDIKELSTSRSEDSGKISGGFDLKDYRIFNEDKSTIKLTGYIQLDPDELTNIFSKGEIELEVSKGKIIRYPTNDTILISVSIRPEKNRKATFEVIYMEIPQLFLFDSSKNKSLILGTDGLYRYEGQGKSIPSILINLIRKKFLKIPAVRNIEAEPITDETARPVETSGKSMANEFLRYEKETSRNKEEIFEQINKDISEIFPSYKRIVSKTEDNQKKVNVYFDKFPSSSVGTGINQLFVSIFDLNSYDHVIIGFEEPEIHLHPKAQRDVFNFLKRISKKKQIVLTTHSSIFTDCSENTRLYLVRKGPENIACIENIEEKEKFKLIKYELGARNYDLFFYDFVIIVEGDTEEKAIPILINSRGKNISKLGGTLINIRGKDRLGRIQEFLTYIKNSDVKFFIIVDNEDGVKERMDDMTRQKLLTSDNYHIWSKGTFVDCFDERHVIQAMKNLYPKKFDMTEKQIKDQKDKGIPTEKILRKYLYERELGELNKPALGEEIALIIKEEITKEKERKETEIEKIIGHIFQLFSLN